MNPVKISYVCLKADQLSNSYTFVVNREGYEPVQFTVTGYNPLLPLAKEIRAAFPDIGDRDLLMLADDLRWQRLREMAAYRAFRKLVPYLEKKSAKSLFLAGRTTTAEAFRRGAEFGRRHGR